MSILNMIASGTGGDWTTATATGYKAGTSARPHYELEFSVEREPSAFVIVRTSTSNIESQTSDVATAICCDAEKCLCAWTTSGVNYASIVDHFSHLTISKSNSTLLLQLANKGIQSYYGRFEGEYTLYYV